MLPRRTATTITLTILCFLGLPHVPGFSAMPGVTGSRILAVFHLRFAEKPTPVVSAPPPPKADDRVPAPHLIVPPHSLDRLFESFRAGSATRILHYGDSPTTADSITSGIRRILQARFGDAGHGFLLIAPPWAWYGHMGTSLDSSGWQIQPASQARAKDHIHGLGGVNFVGTTGATSHVTLTTAHSGGMVYYLAEPGGGAFTVSSGETEIASIQTDAPAKAVARAGFHFPEGAKSLDLRVTRGPVRLFGYRFDKEQPGVQYSSIGINGAQVQMIVRYFEVSQWQAALREENPALVVLNYGTNESIYAGYVETAYAGELRTVISRIREALPGSSLLLMSPMDRGVRNDSGEIVTPAVLTKLVEVQRAVAEETGCAFYNTFEAMGGAGTMARWYEMQPRLVSGDFIHPLPQGADQVAALFASALLEAYGKHQ